MYRSLYWYHLYSFDFIFNNIKLSQRCSRNAISFVFIHLLARGPHFVGVSLSICHVIKLPGSFWIFDCINVCRVAKGTRTNKRNTKSYIFNINDFLCNWRQPHSTNTFLLFIFLKLRKGIYGTYMCATMLYDSLHLLVNQLHAALTRLFQPPNLSLHQQLKRNFRYKQGWTRTLMIKSIMRIWMLTTTSIVLRRACLCDHT